MANRARERAGARRTTEPRHLPRPAAVRFRLILLPQMRPRWLLQLLQLLPRRPQAPVDPQPPAAAARPQGHRPPAAAGPAAAGPIAAEPAAPKPMQSRAVEAMQWALAQAQVPGGLPAMAAARAMGRAPAQARQALVWQAMIRLRLPRLVQLGGNRQWGRGPQPLRGGAV